MTRPADQLPPLSILSPGTVTAGQAALVGAAVVVYLAAATVGVAVPVAMGGVQESMPAATSQAWTQFQRLYWDDTLHVFTSTAGSNVFAGFAAAPKLFAAATGRVLLAYP